MEEIATKIGDLSDLTIKQLGVVMDELLQCQMYAEVAVIRQLILDNRDPVLDGSTEDVITSAGSVSGKTYKDLQHVAGRLDEVGLSVQADLLRKIAERHREISMLASEDTNPLGIRLP